MVFDYFDYSGVPYDRADHGYEVSYYFIPDGGTTVMQSTVKLMDYLNLTNNVDVGSLEGTTLSSLQSDDALEVIEFMYTRFMIGRCLGRR